MEPVGELNDEEELEEEWHAGVRVALPERGNAQKVFPDLKMFKDVKYFTLETLPYIFDNSDIVFYFFHSFYE